MYSHGLDPGPDLYATDAALRARARPGPDLYATDAALFADAGDRATAALRALERWLVARSFARETDPRGDEDEAAEEETCAVCLGTVSSRGCASTDSVEDRAVTTPCGHGYHLRCLLAALRAKRHDGETTSECPTCRQTLAAHDDDDTTPRLTRTPPTRRERRTRDDDATSGAPPTRPHARGYERASATRGDASSRDDETTSERARRRVKPTRPTTRTVVDAALPRDHGEAIRGRASAAD